MDGLIATPSLGRANAQQFGGAAIGTVFGAGLGAAAGGGGGAAIGAGAVAGTAYSGNAAARGTIQRIRSTTNAYAQFMYSRGNQVPGYVAAPAYGAPPPPPGYAPLPPDYPPPPR